MPEETVLCAPCLLVPLSVPEPGLLPMRITELPPTRFNLPERANPVYIATQRWALEPWEGEDPLHLDTAGR